MQLLDPLSLCVFSGSHCQVLALGRQLAKAGAPGGRGEPWCLIAEEAEAALLSFCSWPCCSYAWRWGTESYQDSRGSKMQD